MTELGGHGSFKELSQVADVMRSYPGVWAVAGGWAVSLHAGVQFREHEDVELAVLYDDQLALWELIRDWQPVYVSKPSYERVPWGQGEVLKPPVHEIHTRPPAVPEGLEILLNQSAGSDWVYRRDHRIRRPLAQTVLVHPPTKIPYLAPEVGLLYKAKYLRQKDHQDFEVLAPLLTASQLSWLNRALHLERPDHPWLANCKA